MSRTLVVAPRATADIDQTAHWYNRNQTAHAGFLRAVDKTVDFLVKNPEQYQVVYRQMRRALLDGYPYALFYTVTETHVTVLACLHTARDPSAWP